MQQGHNPVAYPGPQALAASCPAWDDARNACNPNNRSQRALRCGVLWRKRSLGTASDKGNRWVERMLSLKETCRLRSVSTYHVLVDAVRSFFSGQQPSLAWLQ